MSFASPKLRTHLLRGAGGLGVLALALRLEHVNIWLSLALVSLAIWLLKGCPMCWTIGLFETMAQRFLARHEDAPPVDQNEIST